MKSGPKDPKSAEEALENILSGKIGSVELLSENSAYYPLRDYVLQLCLDTISQIRKYDHICREVYDELKKEHPAPAAQPEYKAAIREISVSSGLNKNLLDRLESSHKPNEEIELAHLDLAVEILRKTGSYNGIFDVAKGCIEEGERRGVSGSSYLRKAYDILSDIKQLKKIDGYDALMESMIPLAKDMKYVTLHRQLLKRRGRTNELVEEGRNKYLEGLNLSDHLQSLAYSDAITYLLTAGDEGISQIKSFAHENESFRKEIERSIDIYYKKAESKTGKEKQEFLGKGDFYSSLLKQ